jgi:nucleotide-binding universal stress UspA family protein
VSEKRTDPLVIVGVDGSNPARAALRWAAAFAHTMRARLDVITVWHTPTTFAGPGYIPAVADLSVEYEKLLNEVVDDVFGSDRPASMTLHVREGNAAHVLIEASKDAELVVVGSRGHGGFAGLLLGSVSAKLAEHAACPVLIHHGNVDAPEAWR